MLSLLLSSLSLATAQECSHLNNLPNIKVNEDCNFAGTCRFNKCICCELDPITLLPKVHSTAGTLCPYWSGGSFTDDPQSTANQCEIQTKYASAVFRYYFPSGLSCDDMARREEIRAKFQEWYEGAQYYGVIDNTQNDLTGCTECTPTEPCSNFEGSPETGVQLILGSDFHTFYWPSCFDREEPTPITFQDSCVWNYDDGYLAWLTFERARKYNPAAPDDFDADTDSDFLYVNDELGTGITASHLRIWSSQEARPLIAPPNICELVGTVNQRDDLKFKGIADDCRGGIRPEWKGGQTCDSPYIICLPRENTPNQYPKDPFYTADHRYTLDQCSTECSFDQRCRGFEFVADAGTNVGDCNLIDDIPMVMQNPDPTFTLINSFAGINLNDLSVFSRPAICVEKQDYCNPFMQESDLDEFNVQCYCPNNRKGFYTKKVKRAVENYVACDGDAERTSRIRLAAANRMFHLCENWCLFNVYTPELESWYWNPWQKCFRIQYAGTGMHRSYCNRVITNPTDPGDEKVIEQYFINWRRDNFCQTGEHPQGHDQTYPPTGQPTDFAGATEWYLAEEEESCDTACANQGYICSDAETAKLGESASDNDVQAAFEEAGHLCTKYGVAPKHYAAPSLKTGSEECLRRHDSTEENKGCQWPTGVGYKRLCACVVPSEGTCECAGVPNPSNGKGGDCTHKGGAKNDYFCYVEAGVCADAQFSPAMNPLQYSYEACNTDCDTFDEQVGCDAASSCYWDDIAWFCYDN